MIRTFDYRIDVYRNGVLFDTLKTVDSPIIMGDGNANIGTSMSASILPNNRFNLLTDTIRPLAIIDGVEHYLGEYYVSRAEKKRSGINLVLDIEAYDASWILDQTKFESVYSLSLGENCVNAVIALLVNAGITKYKTTPSALVLPYALEWQVGTSYLTAINDLLKIINYDSLFFDNLGYATVQPYKSPSVSNITHTLSANTTMSVIARDNTKTTDIFNAPNVFIAICASPDSDETLSAVSVNDSPISEMSTVRRGRRIATVVQVDSIADQDTLQKYAEKIKNESLLTTEVVTITTAILPGFSVNDIIAITHPDINGIFRENKWSINLSTQGQMTHTLQRMILV